MKRRINHNFLNMKKILGTLIIICVTCLMCSAQTYVLPDKWVVCGNGVEICVPFYSDGETFEWTGSSRNGKANGAGIATRYKNGKKVSQTEGIYSEGVLDGFAKITSDDGSIIQGAFKNGLLNGKGTMDCSDGTHYEGQFINNSLHGDGVITYPDGSKFDGYIVRDKPYTGIYTTTDGEEFLYQYGLRVDEIDETESKYSPKIGKIVKEYYDDEFELTENSKAPYYRLITYSAPHKPIGVVRDYYSNGEMLSEHCPIYIDYKDQGKNFYEGEIKKFYKSGNIMLEGTYLNNFQNGTWKEYNTDASLKSVYNFDKGILHGNCITYFPSTTVMKSVYKYNHGRLPNNKYLKFEIVTLEGGTQPFPYLVYREDFVRNIKDWETSGQKGIVQVLDENNVRIISSPHRKMSGGIYTNFSSKNGNKISVTTYQCTPNAGEVSLMTGFKDWDNYCSLSVLGDSYYIELKNNGATIWRFSEEDDRIVHPDKNILSIENIQDRTLFYINGISVGEVNDIEYLGKQCVVSLYNDSSNPISMVVSNLEISEPVASNEVYSQYMPDVDADEWTGNGSGFFITNDGYIATNNHVVDGVSDLLVVITMGEETKSYPAEIIKTDPINDMAIIKISDPRKDGLGDIPYSISGHLCSLGTEVFAMGYPATHHMGKSIKVTTGNINSKAGMFGDKRYYQMSAPIQPGNSGGPLFDLNGNLVGINTLCYNGDRFIAQNANYSIKTTMLRDFIESCTDLKIPNEFTPKKRQFTDMVAAYEPFVVLILTR